MKTKQAVRPSPYGEWATVYFYALARTESNYR